MTAIPTGTESSATETPANDFSLKPPLFPLGQIVATAAVHDHFTRHDINPFVYLERHRRGDWGDVPPEDAQENDLSVQNGFRVLSAYQIAGERVWLITEADRSSTTFLFPREY